MCVSPRGLEVCCKYVMYPTSPEQINDQVARLREYGNRQAIDAYNVWLARNELPTEPEGHLCVKWGKSHVDPAH